MLSLKLNPDHTWNSYIWSITKNIGKMVGQGIVSDSFCDDFSSQEIDQTHKFNDLI